jgi:hypothetical protein
VGWKIYVKNDELHFIVSVAKWYTSNLTAFHSFRAAVRKKSGP